MEKEKNGVNEKFFFEKDVNFECVLCGNCCKGWAIHVDPSTYYNLIKTDFYKKIKKENNNEELMVYNKDEDTCKMKIIDNKCCMLNKNNTCKIHTLYGEETKPLTCQWYPVVLSCTPDGIYIGVDYGCKGVQKGKGRSLEDRKENIKRLFKSAQYTMLGIPEVKIADRLSTDWEGYKQIENFITKTIEKEELIEESLWKAFISMAMLCIDFNKKSIEKIKAIDIKKFLETPLKMPFERDEVYLYQENQFNMFMVILVETIDMDKELRMKISNNLFSGGNFHCRSFNIDINSNDVKEYSIKNPFTKEKELKKYIKSLIWLKIILKKIDIITGMALILLIIPLFKWYYYVSAISRKAESPEEVDYYKALSIVESITKHDYQNSWDGIPRSFAESVIKQVAIYQ